MGIVPSMAIRQRLYRSGFVFAVLFVTMSLLGSACSGSDSTSDGVPELADIADADRPALPFGVLLVGLLASWLRARDLNIASQGMLQAAALGVRQVESGEPGQVADAGDVHGTTSVAVRRYIVCPQGGRGKGGSPLDAGPAPS